MGQFGCKRISFSMQKVNHLFGWGLWGILTSPFSFDWMARGARDTCQTRDEGFPPNIPLSNQTGDKRILCTWVDNRIHPMDGGFPCPFPFAKHALNFLMKVNIKNIKNEKILTFLTCFCCLLSEWLVLKAAATCVAVISTSIYPGLTLIRRLKQVLKLWWRYALLFFWYAGHEGL